MSIEAWCTNSTIPREEIREGQINKGGRDFPDYVMISNITRPTLPCYPPEESESLWIFLSHLSSTFMTLGNADSLKAFLRLYNWSHEEGKNRRIEGISDVHIDPAEQVIGGQALRGLRMTVTVLSSHFDGAGDLHLFGEALKEFLAQYVSINSFAELALVQKPSGHKMIWNSIEGRRWLI